jgi:hypothetical protein
MNPKIKTIGAAGFALAAALAVTNAVAGPADYVSVPNVTKGEREIDFKAGGIGRNDDPRVTAASLGFGYGVTDTWFSEIYGKYKRTGENGTTFDAFEWENKFQLTQQGQYPVDIGFITEIERPQDRSEGYEVKFGCVFHANWTPVPPQTGQSFQRKLDTCSMPNWTPVPRQTGHHGRDGAGLRCGFTPDGASLSNWPAFFAANLLSS